MLEGMSVTIHIVSVSSGRRKNLDALRTKFWPPDTCDR